MPRIPASPRWLALHLLAVVLVILCILLGLWQYSRYQEQSRPRLRVDPAPAPLDEVLPAGDRMRAEVAGRKVTATGHYDAENQLLVPDRDLRGESGLFVLTPLLLADGSAIPVVRGWLPSVEHPAATVPPGPVSVAGRLEPSESAEGSSPTALPPGQISAVSTAALLNVWPHSLRDGYLALSAQTPPAAGLRPVPAALPQARSGGRAWQNAAYTIEWWFFGGFVVFMWWRMIREERHRARADQSPEGEAADDRSSANLPAAAGDRGRGNLDA